MAHHWKQTEKHIYLPKNQPELANIPTYKYFCLHGSGNPNHPSFAQYISVLFSLAYAVKMSPKKNKAPEGYQEYSVYPLEGVWDLTEEGRANYNGSLDKDALVFDLMIRQPDFVDAAYANQIVEQVRKQKPHALLQHVRFEEQAQGSCIQMLHLGSYDTEPASFARMEAFALAHGLKRLSLTHREIYLNDARKVAPEKLKTVLRFAVEALEGPSQQSHQPTDL